MLFILVVYFIACCYKHFLGICMGKYGKFMSVCYGDLGCFNTGAPFFNPFFRPINFLPVEPSILKTAFLLYTRESPSIPQNLSRTDINTVFHSSFDSKKKTVFVIHGFVASFVSFKELRQALLEVSDVNVILVDWSYGAVFPFHQATANARMVGRELGNFLISLKNKLDVDLRNVHIIGHSIGAHVAGYAGKWLNETAIGRITGLDPAGPTYQYMPPEVRLDPTDALFVDVIHSSGSNFPYTSLGLLQQLGHIDIYVNGGQQRRGCFIQNYDQKTFYGFTQGIFEKIYCGHETSVFLYIQSVRRECHFTSYACEDYASYRAGKCSTCRNPGIDCIHTGYYVDKFNSTSLADKFNSTSLADKFNSTSLANAKFYITTSEEVLSLCLHHWILEIGTVTTENVNGEIQFHLYITGANNSRLYTTLKIKSIHQKESYRFLLEFYEDPIIIHTVKFFWLYSNEELNGNSNANSLIYINNITLFPMDIIESSLRNERTSTFCIDELLFNGITLNQTVILKRKPNCNIFNTFTALEMK